jgi:chloride channel 7
MSLPADGSWFSDENSALEYLHSKEEEPAVELMPRKIPPFEDDEIPQGVRHQQHNHHLESMDFMQNENMVWKQHHLQRAVDNHTESFSLTTKVGAYKWMMVVVTGILIAVVGIGAEKLTFTLFHAKFAAMEHYMHAEQQTDAFFIWVGISMGLALAASVLCVYEPLSAGSGIPEVKSYLNGVNIDPLLRFKVFWSKWLGLCFSCASGLALGKEGPMVHLGAIVGAAVSQCKSQFENVDASFNKFQALRNDKAKRDYVTFGAAAGIAAAFRAPIGGILFTLEEGASFWSPTVTIRSFLCATVTLLATSIFFLGRHINRGMLAFGNFNDFDEGLTNFYPTDLLVFMLMGIMGGLFGAFYNFCHVKWQQVRTKYGFIGTSYKRVIEVCIVALLMAALGFGISLRFGCTDMPTTAETDAASFTKYEIDLLHHLVHFQCGESQYNEVASLYLTEPAIAMQQLFHFKEYDGTPYETFSTSALLLFTIPYFLLATLSPGLLCPAGLFVPTLLSGAGFGRLVGHTLNETFPGEVADSGTYALMGAAAVLGGVNRATVAAAIIIVEACGKTTYLLPLMLVFVSARYSGNLFNVGIYHIMIDLKNLPHLDGTVPRVGLIAYQQISDYMSKNIVTLEHVALLSTIREALDTSHHGFPVINEKGNLCGFILRKHRTTLISLKCFSYPTEEEGGWEGGGGELKSLKTAASVSHSSFEKHYPQYAEIGDNSNANPNPTPCTDCVWIDLRPYMDTSPYVIFSTASVSKTYRLFRTLGLRHVVILESDSKNSNSNNDRKPVGIITRHDLRKEKLLDKGLSPVSLQMFPALPVLPPAVVDIRQRRLVSTTTANTTATTVTVTKSRNV